MGWVMWLSYAKSISLSAQAWEIAELRAGRTKQSLSKTVDFIIKEWGEMKVLIQEHRANQKVKDIKKAKVIKSQR